MPQWRPLLDHTLKSCRFQTSCLLRPHRNSFVHPRLTLSYRTPLTSGPVHLRSSLQKALQPIHQHRPSPLKRRPEVRFRGSEYTIFGLIASLTRAMQEVLLQDLDGRDQRHRIPIQCILGQIERSQKTGTLVRFSNHPSLNSLVSHRN